jgi:hypothetical protein
MPFFSAAQQDSAKVYKKRVLEATEVDLLSSYYQQNGQNASVTGGIGKEALTDVTPTIVVSMPLNADDVLTIDAGFSTYTSASSSNLDPFDLSGASGGHDDDHDDEHEHEHGDRRTNPEDIFGTPWAASSGASRQDTWTSLSASYTHNSDDRNRIWNANVSFAREYDYRSLGFGGSYTRQFNEKNTEIGLKANVFLDAWNPKYPTELDTYLEVDGNLNAGFFEGIPILNEQGNSTNKAGANTWRPVSGFGLINDKGRNTYSLSFSFSQILSRRAQFSLFFDIVQQQGWLANPTQRVYFADRPDYFIGTASSIPNYTSPTNLDVFMLADDFERLPDSRFKTPVGARLHYYLNEILTLRLYYRYYFDNWGIDAHTLNAEMPVKISQKFTLYPSYRFYNQTAADSFAPFNSHQSTSQYYTSDYDLSKYHAHQFGFGISYTDIFTNFHVWNFGLKNIDLKYNYYERNTGLKAHYFGLGVKMIMNK